MNPIRLNLTWKLTHFLGLEHRYCWFPKKLEMFQAREKDSPRPRKRLVVCTDACNQGLGGVLMQDNHIVEPNEEFQIIPLDR